MYLGLTPAALLPIQFLSWSIFAVSIILFARLRAAVTSAVTSRDRPRSPDELRKKESAVTTNLSDTVMHDLHRGLIE